MIKKTNLKYINKGIDCTGKNCLVPFSLFSSFHVSPEVSIIDFVLVFLTKNIMEQYMY